MTRAQALVLWSRENKVGIEAISNVPSNARFEGAVTPVIFGGDKKFYPAKILMISDNLEALEAKMAQVEADIEEQKKSAEAGRGPGGRRSRRGTKPPKPNAGAASDRAVAIAVGGRPPVPKDLVHAHQASQQDRRDAKVSLVQGNAKTDHRVMAEVKKKLVFSPNKNVTHQSDSESEGSDDTDVEEGKEVNQDCDRGEEPSENSQALDVRDKWCNCNPCVVLKKYDIPSLHSFFNDIGRLFQGNVDLSNKKQIRFLELLPIKEELKKVELVAGHGIYISQVKRDELKVDFRNKPGQLARETLYALYGKETFQTVVVTGRGNKSDTYTIPDQVKKAVASFVSKYTSKDKVFTTKNLVAMINKRAPEWRQTTSPKSTSKKSLKRSIMAAKSPKSAKSPKTTTPVKSPKVSGMSPFKVTPTKGFDDVMASLNGKGSPKNRGGSSQGHQVAVPSTSASAPSHGHQWSDPSRPTPMASEFPHQSSAWDHRSSFTPRPGPSQGPHFESYPHQMSNAAWAYPQNPYTEQGYWPSSGSTGMGPGSHWRPYDDCETKFEQL